ncbi:DMT family transporter [Tropicimonas sp. IMCC34043]|uniref:DMT family transporter n=1 Tax=Tropicimonas sp. IMCC34043 TaxID=2248760 RepID=UPI0021014BD7|nr:DMT family transporter [Tropicimonas sp. IMCC34043]
MTRARLRGLSDNLRGAAFMVAAMAGFALEDMSLKGAAQSLPVGQVMMLFGLGGTLAFALLARQKGEPLLHPDMVAPRMLLRMVAESTGRLFYTLAIALTPLVSASAILQATPLVVVAGAALLFGETVGWRRWAAILAGLAGVLLILRPGLSGFEPASVLALLGMLGFAGRDLATRAAPKRLSNAQLGLCGFAVIAPTGALLLVVMGARPVWNVAAFGMVGAGVLVGVAAYSLLTAAMRCGEVSVVTPFRYTRLLFGIALGILVFGERPDAAMLAGSAIVLAAGLYTLLRDRRASRRAGAPGG